MRLGCQSITFRNATPPWPLPAALDAIAAAGFEGVELTANTLDLLTPERLAALVGERGLQVVALHLNSGNFDPEAKPRNPVDMDALRECLRICGVPFVLTSGTGGRRPDDLALLLGAAGRELATLGATLCYHNHGPELEQDARWLAEFCAAGDPAHVGLAFDLGWAARVGAEPAVFIRRFAERIRYVHIKDTAGDIWTELGRGQVDLPAALGALQACALPWWVAEQDRCDGDPGESVRVNGAYLRDWRRTAAT